MSAIFVVIVTTWQTYPKNTSTCYDYFTAVFLSPFVFRCR